MAKKIIVDKALLQEAHDLAAKGYPTDLIAESLQLSRSFVFGNKDMMDAIKEGRAAAKREVVDTLMARSISDQSPTALIYLSKQLRIFDDHFTTSRPKDAKEATERLAKIYEAVARGELDQEKADRLAVYLEKFIKAYEVTDLEARVIALEEQSR